MHADNLVRIRLPFAGVGGVLASGQARRLIET
jgi:hypothetical protein